MSVKVSKLLANRTVLLLLLLAVSVIVMLIATNGFISVQNLLGITQFGAVLVLLGLGQSIVMMAGGGGVDLSIGSTMSLSGVLFGMLCLQGGMNYLVAAVLAIVIGILLGSVNGVIISFLKLPPFIVTLSTSYMYASLALYLTGGVPLSGFSTYFAWIGQGTTLMIPNQVLFVVLPIVLILLYAVNKTKYGRYLYAAGANATAARFAGINIEKLRCVNYMVNGALAGTASIVMCSWLMTARADAGSGYDLSSIAVSVLGGIAINGGSGRLSGVLVSVVIITLISTGIQYANLNGIWQLAVLGMILLASVSLNHLLIYHDLHGKRKNANVNEKECSTDGKMEQG